MKKCILLSAAAALGLGVATYAGIAAQKSLSSDNAYTADGTATAHNPNVNVTNRSKALANEEEGTTTASLPLKINFESSEEFGRCTTESCNDDNSSWRK